MKAAGEGTNSADKLIAFRIQRVTPEFVKSVRALGFAPTDDQLIAMRIHRVTPEYITDLRSRGVKSLTVDQLINLRIHNIM